MEMCLCKHFTYFCANWGLCIALLKCSQFGASRWYVLQSLLSQLLMSCM